MQSKHIVYFPVLTTMSFIYYALTITYNVHLVYNPMSYMGRVLICNKLRAYSVISYTNTHVIYMH